MRSGESRDRRIPWRRIILVAMLVILATAAVAVIRSRRLPTLVREDFNAAKFQWQSKQPSSYEITVEVKGMQPGVYEVAVVDGIARSATFDGHALTRPRTFGTWSVPGMFDTLARDLETNDREGNLMLGVEFHPEFGIPVRYERIELRTGVHDALQWMVTRFQPTP